MASQAQSANRRTFRILHASGGSSFWNHVYSTIPLVTVPVCQLKPNNIALTVDVDDIGSETWRVNCNDTCCPHQPRLIIYLGVRMGRCYKFQLEVGFVVLNSFLTFIRPVFFPLDLYVGRIFRILPLLFLKSGCQPVDIHWGTSSFKLYRGSRVSLIFLPDHHDQRKR